MNAPGSLHVHHMPWRIVSGPLHGPAALVTWTGAMIWAPAITARPCGTTGRLRPHIRLVRGDPLRSSTLSGEALAGADLLRRHRHVGLGLSGRAGLVREARMMGFADLRAQSRGPPTSLMSSLTRLRPGERSGARFRGAGAGGVAGEISIQNFENQRIQRFQIFFE